MDLRTQTATSERIQREPKRGTAARGLMIAMIWGGVIAASAGFGYRLARTQHDLPGWAPSQLAALLGRQVVAHRPAPAGRVLYYRDPYGKPYYSMAPKKSEDGQDYVPVLASEDVNFDDQSAKAPAAPSQSERGKRVLYFRNPMGLPDTSPVPKKDSMGMDYVPVYEGEAGDGTAVFVSAGKLQRTGVRSELVSRRVLTWPVRAPGAVKLDERRVAVVSMRSDSFIDKVENVTTGDRVKKSQPLLRLFSPEIAAASAQYLSVLAESGASAVRPVVVEGARRRLQNLNVPPDVIADIERTRKIPVTITWSAPRDGIILERNAVDGMMATSGLVLFRLADISVVWVIAEVAEHELGMVKIGQSVTIRARSLPGRTFTGHIALIYPQVSTDTRTTRVRVEIPNALSLLVPDMYVDVEVDTVSGAPVVAVPDSALIDAGTRQVVIIDKGDGRFEPRDVKVGARGEGFIEIREGVVEGDEVVVAANFLIDAESNLKAALRGMTAPGNPQ